MKSANFSFVFSILITLVFSLHTGNVYADTLHLKNGDVISGKLTTFVDGLCIFNTKYGSSISLTTDEIASLSTDDEYEIVFVSGERVNGRLSLNNVNAPVLISKTFGETGVNPDDISSMTRVFSNSKQATSTQGKDQAFGEEERETPPLDFLTGSTVLLAPGSYELGLGFAYQQSRRETSLMNVGYFQRSAYTARKLQFSLTVRAGLYDRFEGWLNLPGDYTYIQEVSTNAYVRDTDSWELGDISFGLQYLMLTETETSPAISATIGVSAPTGKKRYYPLGQTWLDPLNNSSGHWGLTVGTSFVRTLDPAILFGGLSYSHSFSETIDGYHVSPGWGINGYFGVGFALNEKLSLGSRLALGYKSTMEVDGVTVEGSDSEPMDLSFSTSYRFADNWVATPQVTFTLNDDAGANAFSLQVARRF